MFVRTKVFRNKNDSTRTNLQLVAGKLVGDKALPKAIASLGRLEQL